MVEYAEVQEGDENPNIFNRIVAYLERHQVFSRHRTAPLPLAVQFNIAAFATIFVIPFLFVLAYVAIIAVVCTLCCVTELIIGIIVAIKTITIKAITITFNSMVMGLRGLVQSMRERRTTSEPPTWV